MFNIFRLILVFSISVTLVLPALALEEYGSDSSIDRFTGPRFFDTNQSDSPFLSDIDAYRFAQNEGQMTAQDGTEAVEEKEAGAGGYTDEEIAEMINNPLGNLWLLFSQNDTVWISGDALDRINEDDTVFNQFLINPVLPMQLTENWKYIFRPVIPINSYNLPSGISIGTPPDPPTGTPPSINVDFERETGLGDIILWNAFSTNESATPPNIFGAGFTMMMDTASDDRLGLGKWSAGPMALGMRITDKWILGLIYQHYWSFAGDRDRDDVNLSDLQYIVRYRLTPETNIGFGPNIRYNWDADSGERLSFPVGLGADTLIKIGPLPIKIGIESYYYVESPDALGPKWQIRLFFTPVIPKPGWSKAPIFGN